MKMLTPNPHTLTPEMLTFPFSQQILHLDARWLEAPVVSLLLLLGACWRRQLYRLVPTLIEKSLQTGIDWAERER
jgi:hypothetical protein